MQILKINEREHRVHILTVNNRAGIRTYKYLAIDLVPLPCYLPPLRPPTPHSDQSGDSTSNLSRAIIKNKWSWAQASEGLICESFGTGSRNPGKWSILFTLSHAPVFQPCPKLWRQWQPWLIKGTRCHAGHLRWRHRDLHHRLRFPISEPFHISRGYNTASAVSSPLPQGVLPNWHPAPPAPWAPILSPTAFHGKIRLKGWAELFRRTLNSELQNLDSLTQKMWSPPKNHHPFFKKSIRRPGHGTWPFPYILS